MRSKNDFPVALEPVARRILPVAGGAGRGVEAYDHLGAGGGGGILGEPVQPPLEALLAGPHLDVAIGEPAQLVRLGTVEAHPLSVIHNSVRRRTTTGQD